MAEGAARGAIEILQREQTQIGLATSPQTNVNISPTITKINAYSNESGKWVADEVIEENPAKDENVVNQTYDQIENDAIVLREFCATVDNKILQFNAQINTLKDQIVTLSTEAINRNCWPGIAKSTLSTGITTSFGANTNYLYDQENISRYIDMEGPSPNYGSLNPFTSTTSALSSTLVGYGYTNSKSDDGGSSSAGTARFDISTTQSNHLSRTFNATGINTTAIWNWTYDGVGVSPGATNTTLTGTTGADRCIAIANSITSLQSQIVSIRVQRDALRSDLNIIKTKKTEKDLQNWGINNHKRQVDDRKTSNNSIITAIQNLS
jgi:hypothetical protein